MDYLYLFSIHEQHESSLSESYFQTIIIYSDPAGPLRQTDGAVIIEMSFVLKRLHKMTSDNLCSRYVGHFVGMTWHNAWS